MEIHRVLRLPTEEEKLIKPLVPGDEYYVGTVGDDKWKHYKVDNSGVIRFVSGLNEEESIKFSDLKTQSEITTDIETAKSQAVSEVLSEVYVKNQTYSKTEVFNKTETNGLISNATVNASVGAVQVTGNTLPTLGNDNKRYIFTTGSAGRTLTHGATSLTYGANKQCSAFWDGVTKTWVKEDEVELPSVPTAKSFSEAAVNTPLDSTLGQQLQAEKLDLEQLLIQLLEKFGFIQDGINQRFVDSTGRVIFQITSNGVEYYNQIKPSDIASLLSTEALQEELTDRGILQLDNDKFEIADLDGYIIFEVTKDGVKYVDQNNGSSDVKILKEGVFKADINLVVNYGQSLSVAGFTSSATNYYDSLTFAGGVWADYDPSNATARDAYYGSDFISIPQSGRDWAKPILKIVKELIKLENGIDYDKQEYTMMTASAGVGGASWAQLSDKNGIYYKRLIETVQYAMKFAIARGKTFNCPIVTYIQGENSADKNKTVQQFYDNLVSLFDSLNTDIKAITGQTNDVQFITYQTASFGRNSGGTGVPLAFLKIANEKPNVHLGAVMYQLAYSDALHLINDAYRNMYAYMGVVAKKVLIDNENWKHIQPKSHTLQGSNGKWLLSLKMDVPVEPLVFDESVNSRYTTAPINKGFSILNGATEIIQSVSIVRGNTINIVCNANPQGLTLTYAIQGTVSGGNLRDSQGDTITITQADLLGRVDNWCPIFTYNL